MATKNDSLFVTVNNGVYSHLYVTLDKMPESAQDTISKLKVGELYGPFEDNGYYLTVKLLDKKNVPDTVEARHILRTADRANPASLAAARSFIDSLRQVYTSGKSSFDSLAIKHSNDTQSGLKGGDLGKFTQDRMVPEFAHTCFIEGKEGGLYTVETQFGVHLIEIQDQIFNDNDPKYNVSSIGQPIIPSQITQDNRYDEITEIVAANRNIESLTAALEKYPDNDMESSTPVNINAFGLGSLGANQSSRDIIKWAFEPTTEVGDVSPDVFRYTDNVNYYDNKYVLASLKSIIPAGLPTVDAVKSQIETAIINKKKGEKLAASLNVGSMDAVASEHNTTVETASDISLNTNFIPGMGNEPKVIGAAFDLDIQAISKPIVGNSGVYVIQPISKQEAGTANNIPFLKQSLSTTTRSQVDFKIVQNLKERAKIMDDRYKFY
jgi:parvulin-like peptidyl-prolyl isomerase